MARLTKQQRASINRAIYHLHAVRDYLFSDRTAVCHVDSMATTTDHYQRPDGRILYEVEKHYGSDLCRLETALATLKSLDGLLG